MKFLIKNITKILPLLTGGLIFLGIIKVSIYYSFFGIVIFPFVDLSELIMLFIDEMVLYSFFLTVAISLAMMFIHDNITQKKESWSKNIYRVFLIIDRVMALGLFVSGVYLWIAHRDEGGWFAF